MKIVKRPETHDNDKPTIVFSKGKGGLLDKAVVETIQPHYEAIWEAVSSAYSDCDGIQASIIRTPDDDVIFDIKKLRLEPVKEGEDG